MRPDVVISNHDTITTKPYRQHGHHQVVGITIYEAFDKAADPNFHPEQFVNGITPWQIKKLYFRVYDTTRTSGIFTLDIYQKDPSSGKPIVELNYETLSQHKPGVWIRLTGKTLVSLMRRYELVRSDKCTLLEGDDLFEGIAPEDKGSLNVKLESYPTRTHIKVNPEDIENIKIIKVRR
jgi:hypothetical protein